MSSERALGGRMEPRREEHKGVMDEIRTVICVQSVHLCTFFHGTSFQLEGEECGLMLVEIDFVKSKPGDKGRAGRVSKVDLGIQVISESREAGLEVVFTEFLNLRFQNDAVRVDA
jgi:hypothetical protein